MIQSLLKLQHDQFSDLLMHHFPNQYSAMMTLFNKATIHALTVTLENTNGLMPRNTVRDHHQQTNEA